MAKRFLTSAQVPMMALVLTLVFWAATLSCGRRGGEEKSIAACDTLCMRYASNLRILERNGYTEVEILNPWTGSGLLSRYILIDRDVPVPEDVADGATVVRVPLSRVVVYSSVHAGLISDLGEEGVIAGVCDVPYMRRPNLAAGISAGRIADCGLSSGPNIERIMSISPDAIMLSPYQDSGSHGKVGAMGIPIIECADYMETSPLGRAEWIRFYGRLLGRGEEADSMYAEVERNYLSIKEKTAGSAVKPSVIVDRPYSGAWYVPASESTMGRFIEDAGGSNPFSYNSGSGSVGLSPEQILMKGSDADIWLVRYAADTPLTLGSMRADNPLFARFKALADHNVYGCNTLKVPFYEEVPFHPHWLLGELAVMFHPDLMTDSAVERRYFTKLQD